MSPEVIGLLTVQVLRLINNIIEGIPVEQRHTWWRDNQKFWEDLTQKLASGEFKLPDLKLPTLPKPGGQP